MVSVSTLLISIFTANPALLLIWLLYKLLLAVFYYKGSLQCMKNDLISNHSLGIAKMGDMFNFAVTCFV